VGGLEKFQKGGKKNKGNQVGGGEKIKFQKTEKD